MPTALQSSLSARRRQKARDAVIAAARRLLAQGGGERFTMRELADAADLSLVTAYRHFGSKRGVLRAVFDRALASIAERFGRHPAIDDPLERVMTLAEIGADVILAERGVIRAAGRALTAAPSASLDPTLRQEASALWQLAIQTDFPFRKEAASMGAPVLARQLAVMFRGMMSFWISGEVDDAGFRSGIAAGAATIMLALADPSRAGGAAESLRQAEPDT